MTLRVTCTLSRYHAAYQASHMVSRNEGSSWPAHNPSSRSTVSSLPGLLVGHRGPVRDRKCCACLEALQKS
jgi:hypothetical protein